MINHFVEFKIRYTSNILTDKSQILSDLFFKQNTQKQ